MNKIDRYEVAYAANEQTFMYNVNSMIAEGWQPLGALTVINDKVNGNTYYQAMVFYAAN
jgi:hypothetical protein